MALQGGVGEVLADRGRESSGVRVEEVRAAGAIDCWVELERESF